jgi:hypothetical protein
MDGFIRLLWRGAERRRDNKRMAGAQRRHPPRRYGDGFARRSGSRGALLPPRPLRTVHESFPSHSSSRSNAPW